MNAYFDSSILVKIYVPEANSEEAASLIRKCGAALPFSQLHENEVRNAIRLKRRRGELSDVELQAALRRIHEDLADGRLCRPNVNWPEVWTKADSLSAQHDEQVNCRTLDTLHVALAVLLGFKKFVSFDEHQRALAAAVGLGLCP